MLMNARDREENAPDLPENAGRQGANPAEESGWPVNHAGLIDQNDALHVKVRRDHDVKGPGSGPGGDGADKGAARYFVI